MERLATGKGWTTLRIIGTDITPLRTAFNGVTDQVRLIVLVSPT